MKKLFTKTTSIFLSLAMLLSLIPCVCFSVSAEVTDKAAILEAACAYVTSKQNDVTKAGLLSAVQAVNSDVTLADADYFIKHAVPGVTDDDTQSGYQICIPGSDGAVSAVFELEGERFGFVQSFAHTEEILHINEVAVVGTSEGFTYSGKDVIGYSGTADKIIFPKGYYGVMTELADKSSVNNVKAVVIDTDDPANNYKTCTRIKPSAFAEWQGLVAVQFGEHAHARLLFDNVSANKNSDGGTYHIFARCPNLKYVKLPTTLYGQNTSISAYMFNECGKLENVIFTENADNTKTYFGNRAFAYTGIYDFFLPSWAPMNADQQGYAFYGGKCRTAGQVINYSENMTMPRAVALIASKAGDFAKVGTLTESEVLSTLKNAVTGSADSETFKETLELDWTDTSTAQQDSGIVTVTNGTDSYDIPVKGARKGLQSLTVTGFDLSPAFATGILGYTVTVPNGTTSVEVKATCESGTVDITGNEGLEVGENTVDVIWEYNGEPTVYTITVIVRNSDAVVNGVKALAAETIKAKQNDLTADNLLSAVQASYPTVALDKTNDFFIKHAVPGVTDDDTQSGYQISIPGTDGAVSAVFTLNGERIAVAQSFEHTEETLHINEVAVVGTSEGFTYSGKDVIGYSGTADKIVFPKGYYGVMTELADKSSVNNVKAVVIDTDDPANNYKTCTRIKPSAFAEWQGLVAVQFGEHAHPRLLFDNVSANKTSDGGTYNIFARCPNLKYVKLPTTIYGQNTSISGYMFDECRKLENVIFTESSASDARYFGNRAFAYTNVYDFFLPSWAPMNAEQQGYAFYGGLCRTKGQVINYSENMTMPRAVALIASFCGDLDETNTALAEVKIADAVKGSADASAFADALDFDFDWQKTGNTLKCTISVSDGIDTYTIDYTTLDAAVGDVNGDGAVNILDIIRMKKALAGAEDISSVRVFDVNGDKAVSATDLASLVYAILNGTNFEKDNMYVKWDNEVLNVVQKYSSVNDFVFVMKKQGGNNIFNIASPLAISNTSSEISSDLASARELSSLGVSDWFGPHKIYAKANKDGDNPGAWSYTGGAHNYYNNETYNGAVTGRSDNIVITVDGNVVENGFTGYAKNIVITWDNYVQGFNTMKTDGTGREVLKEHHTVSYSGDVWETQTDITFFEQVGWYEYYGNQCILNNLWHDAIKYGDGEWQKFQSGVATQADTYDCDRMLIRGAGGDYLEMTIDNSYGIGDRRYLETSKPGAYHKAYGNDKAYFNLVSGDRTIEAGTEVSYRGTYNFFSVK